MTGPATVSLLAFLLIASGVGHLTAAAEDLRRVLERRVAFEFVDEDIEFVAERLAMIGGITVRLDQSIAERREEIPPINFRADDMALGNAFR